MCILTTRFILSLLWLLTYSLFGRHISFFLIYANNFWNCTHVCVYKILMAMDCEATATNISYLQAIFVLHIYDSFCIPCLADLFAAIHKYFTFGSLICFLTSATTSVFLVGLHISFSLFMPVTFEIIFTCVSLQNTNAYLVLSASYKYSHLEALFVVSHLWSLIYIPCLKDMFSGITLCHNYLTIL